MAPSGASMQHVQDGLAAAAAPLPLPSAAGGAGAAAGHAAEARLQHVALSARLAALADELAHATAELQQLQALQQEQQLGLLSPFTVTAAWPYSSE